MDPVIENITTSSARPAILKGCTMSEVKKFVSDFNNYAMHGGTMTADTFIHADVISFFHKTRTIDLSSKKFKGKSDEVVQFLKSIYKSNVDCLTVLASLAMPSSVTRYDRDSIDTYQMKYFATLDEYRDEYLQLEQSAVVDIFFQGIQPASLREMCARHRKKTIAEAVQLLQSELARCETALQVKSVCYQQLKEDILLRVQTLL